MKAIDLHNVSKTYKRKHGLQVNALRNVSLSIDTGEIFGFLGPNGAGKSTTIKILMDLIRSSSGAASILGYNVESPEARKKVGYLPENPSFYDYLTAQEYLLFAGKMFGLNGSVAQEQSRYVLKLLDLWEDHNRSIRDYSKGMVQRLGLAQALIHDPDVYILDEPMSGLDPLGRSLVKQIMLQLKSRGKCVFFSTHITADVEAVCDRVGILIKGELHKVDHLDAILGQGISGYGVGVKKRDSDEVRDQYVPKEEFDLFLRATIADGSKIIYIEQKRKDLEAFFLDVVKGNTC